MQSFGATAAYAPFVRTSVIAPSYTSWAASGQHCCAAKHLWSDCGTRRGSAFGSRPLPIAATVSPDLIATSWVFPLLLKSVIQRDG